MLPVICYGVFFFAFVAHIFKWNKVAIFLIIIALISLACIVCLHLATFIGLEDTYGVVDYLLTFNKLTTAS